MEGKKFYVLMYSDKFYAPYYNGNAVFYDYAKISDMIHDDITFAVRFGSKELALNMLRRDCASREAESEVDFNPSLSKVAEVDVSTLEIKIVD